MAFPADFYPVGGQVGIEELLGEREDVRSSPRGT